jgi:ABC-2 type transport system permease protein
MRGTLAIFKACMKNWIRSRSGVFFSFLFPLLLLLIFGTVFGEQGEVRYTLYVQNLDLENGQPSLLSQAFLQALESVRALRIENLAPTVDVETYVREHPSFTSYRILIIPENFHRKAENKAIYVRTCVISDTVKYLLQTYGSHIKENEREAAENGLALMEKWRENMVIENAGILLLTEEGDAAAQVVGGILASVVNVFNNRLIGAESVAEVQSGRLIQRGLKAADYYLPGYIAAFVMTNGVIGVTSITSDFRRRGVMKMLATTPLKKSSWIVGVVLQQTALALMLTLVMVGAGWIIFGVRALPDIWAVLFIVLGAVAFCSLGMAMGGSIRNPDAAVAAGNAVAFPMMFLSGAFWPVEMMPEFIQTVAKVMPLYYFHDGLRRIMILKNPSQAIPSFLVMTGLATIFLILAIKVTKWREL